MRFARTLFGIAAVAAVAGCAMAPEGVVPAQMDAYDDAVASIGCVMKTEREYAAVELQTGMTRQQAIQMGQLRMATGAAAPVEGGGVRLMTGRCAPQQAA